MIFGYDSKWEIEKHLGHIRLKKDTYKAYYFGGFLNESSYEVAQWDPTAIRDMILSLLFFNILATCAGI